MNDNPVYLGALTTLRDTAAAYAIVAVALMLIVSAAMVLQMRRNPVEWADTEDEIAADGIDVGTAIVLVGLAWPLLLAHILRDLLRPAR